MTLRRVKMIKSDFFLEAALEKIDERHLVVLK